MGRGEEGKRAGGTAEHSGRQKEVERGSRKKVKRKIGKGGHEAGGSRTQ